MFLYNRHGSQYLQVELWLYRGCDEHHRCFRAADSLDAEAREEAVGYHCYRGLVTPETTFWLSQSRTGEALQRGLRVGFRLCVMYSIHSLGCHRS